MQTLLVGPLWIFVYDIIYQIFYSALFYCRQRKKLTFSLYHFLAIFLTFNVVSVFFLVLLKRWNITIVIHHFVVNIFISFVIISGKMRIFKTEYIKHTKMRTQNSHDAVQSKEFRRFSFKISFVVWNWKTESIFGLPFHECTHWTITKRDIMLATDHSILSTSSNFMPNIQKKKKHCLNNTTNSLFSNKHLPLRLFGNCFTFHSLRKLSKTFLHRMFPHALSHFSKRRRWCDEDGKKSGRHLKIEVPNDMCDRKFISQNSAYRPDYSVMNYTIPTGNLTQTNSRVWFNLLVVCLHIA